MSCASRVIRCLFFPLISLFLRKIELGKRKKSASRRRSRRWCTLCDEMCLEATQAATGMHLEHQPEFLFSVVLFVQNCMCFLFYTTHNFEGKRQLSPLFDDVTTFIRIQTPMATLRFLHDFTSLISTFHIHSSPKLWADGQNFGFNE